MSVVLAEGWCGPPTESSVVVNVCVTPHRARTVPTAACTKNQLWHPLFRYYAYLLVGPAVSRSRKTPETHIGISTDPLWATAAYNMGVGTVSDGKQDSKPDVSPGWSLRACIGPTYCLSSCVAAKTEWLQSTTKVTLETIRKIADRHFMDYVCHE